MLYIVENIKESGIKDFLKMRESYLKYYFEGYKIYYFYDISLNVFFRWVVNLDDNYRLKEDGVNLLVFLYYLK